MLKRPACLDTVDCVGEFIDRGSLEARSNWEAALNSRWERSGRRLPWTEALRRPVVGASFVHAHSSVLSVDSSMTRIMIRVSVR
jgi:hypothetical protein